MALLVPVRTSVLAAQQATAPAKPAHHHVQVEDDSPDSRDLSRATDLIQKQDYAAAEPLLRKVTAAEPANYVAWFDLGFVENALGKLDDSIAAYRKSVEAKPSIFESNLNLGLQLAKTKSPEAENFLRAATVLTPEKDADRGRARAWLSLGHVLEKSKPDDALAAFEKAALLAPTDPEPHLSAGPLLESANRFADAEREYKRAQALDPHEIEATIGLANVYMRGRRFPDAERALKTLVTAQPESAAVHIQMGRVLAAEEKYPEAIAELQTGTKLAPEDVSAQRELAEVLNAAGKYDQAEAAYRALVAGHANDAELHHGLGQALLKQKKFMDAQGEFLKTVQLKPDFGDAYGDLAFAASENKNYALTVKALDARAKLVPDVAGTYFLRASALDHLREYKPAAVNYHLFLEAAQGRYPDQEWQARHRLITIEPKK
jgi:tetratricopeptide (TPR) repeat protein